MPKESGLGCTPTEWSLLLRWSRAMEAVHSTLTAGRADPSLLWRIKPGAVKLEDVPVTVLRRSQVAADGPSAEAIADFLAGRR